MNHLELTDKSSLAAEARRVLAEEASALEHCSNNLDQDRFAEAVKLITGCAGRVVVTGIGKAGAIGRKFVGTLCGTGTPALFLHPSEALHGDLGVLSPGDVVCAFSFSGESDEVLAVLPAIGRIDVPIIAFTSRANSTLGRRARVILSVDVEREACPMNLAPTTSTTVMLALSDALAIVVMQANRFTPGDFAARHPSGALGRRLLLSVRDVMRTGDEVAIVTDDATLADAMLAVQRAHAGAAIVVDSEGVLTGLMVEGDFRRLLTQDRNGFSLPMHSVMNRNPGRLTQDMLASEALAKMEEFHPVKGELVGEAPVVDDGGRPIGMLMLKDLIKGRNRSGSMKDVRVIVMDVDGTLTNGAVTIDSEGLESKSFHTSDGLGIRLAQEAGLEVVVISGRKSAAVTKRMRELRVKRVYQGVANKAEIIVKLKSDLEIVDEQIAFIGDDINDLPAFSLVGVRIAVGDGSPILRDRADYVTRRPGGAGAVREAIEEILRAQDKLGQAVSLYLASLASAPSEAPGAVN